MADEAILTEELKEIIKNQEQIRSYFTKGEFFDNLSPELQQQFLIMQPEIRRLTFETEMLVKKCIKNKLPELHRLIAEINDVIRRIKPKWLKLQ